MGEIYLYGYIGDWDEVNAKDFNQALKDHGSGEVTLRINSYGGDILGETPAIVSAIKQHPSKVTAMIDGVAASAATIIALACDHVTMASGARFMIHNPSTWVGGDVDTIERDLKLLRSIEDSMADIYASKTGISKADILLLMDAETWYTAEEALEAGFVDEVYQGLAVAANFDPKKSPFKNKKTIKMEANDKQNLIDGIKDAFKEVAAFFKAENVEANDLTGFKAALDTFKIEAQKNDGEHLKAIESLNSQIAADKSTIEKLQKEVADKKAVTTASAQTSDSKEADPEPNGKKPVLAGLDAFVANIKNHSKN
jgi:ATP-dependent protease ClpP protease subunit